MLERIELKWNFPLLARIQADERYLANLDWGKSRSGHPEGTLRAHIAELEENFSYLKPRLRPEELEPLLVLIHVHDTFKPDAADGVPISHPRSHASLARSFLAEFTDDTQLQTYVQYHDEPFALWRQFKSRGSWNESRLNNLIAVISDWHLFGAFLLMDGCTRGKSSEPLEWFLPMISPQVDPEWTADDARELSNWQRRRF